LILPPVRRTSAFLRFSLCVACGLAAVRALAEPMNFNLPAQPANKALLSFSRQARIEVLFSFDDLRRATSAQVVGRMEPETAMTQLLRGTGFESRRNGHGKFVITPIARPTGSLKGKLTDAGGAGVRGVRVIVPEARQSVRTDEAGEFDFPSLPPGRYEVIATAAGFEPLRVPAVAIEPNRVAAIAPRALRPANDPARLEPFFVEGRTTREPHPLDHSEAPFGPRLAAGNLDLARTESDVLPYTVLNRKKIARSGAVNLNEFLQRELLDGNASALPPDQNGTKESFIAGSQNLSLRGYESDSTVILINGRRMPEILTSRGDTLLPDVNFIPLSLVQQVEVLPVSASSLYSGNAVGGVINIVLRPDVDANATEISTTYTNACGRFDAPQSLVSLLHSESLLGGALRIRGNASFARSVPATESELGDLQRRLRQPTPLDEAIYRATPNLHSLRPKLGPLEPGDPNAASPALPEPLNPPSGGLKIDNTNVGLPPLPGLFGPGSSPVTSVAAGADGAGGLAAFGGRAGVRSTGFFKSPGGFASSTDSLDYPYGRRQRREAYFGSVVYDITRWLQLGADGTYTITTINRGYEVLNGDLVLKAASPFNPFGQDVDVSLNETARNLGENYSQARLEYGAAVIGAIVKLPAEWRVSLDGQYAHNLAKYRGLAGTDWTRWQKLVDAGLYNPLRDTQVFAPPPEFYSVLVYRGAKNRFVTLGNYDTLDLAARATNESLPGPTGATMLNTGFDYRRNHLSHFTDVNRFADGTVAGDVVRTSGRTIAHYSVFGELQAPLLPASWRPRWLARADTDLAVRYVAADRARERNVAPTFGLKLDFAGGFSFRGSVSTSNRVPAPQMWRPLAANGTVAGGGALSIDGVPIFDPVRNQSYRVIENEVLNFSLRPEAALTQTAGVMFERGKIHRVRLALDFVDTRKVNEITALSPATIVGLESTWPEWVVRAPLAPGDSHAAGYITSVTTSTINLAWRHSQNWNASLDYAWTECAGGVLELYGRLLAFTRYEHQLLPSSPITDELRAPDDSGSALLKYRANFGGAWSNRFLGAGIDGHYFHSRVLPIFEQGPQGHDRIRPFWQFDAFVQHDLASWLPWKSSRYGLRVQARVNNVLAAPFPKYVNDRFGADVQPYGDWRGRVYSLSLTASF